MTRPITRLRELKLSRSPADLSREHAASRVSAYVYGNVLVMATLLSLQPDDLRGLTGVLYVLGVGVSTFLAHMVGDAVGRRVREGRSTRWVEVRREIRDALPIGTAATVPTAILLLAWTGLVDAAVVLALALAVTGLRLAAVGLCGRVVLGRALLGATVPRWGRLAVISAGVAALKWNLTH